MKNISFSLDYNSVTDRSVLLEVAVHGEPLLFGLWSFNVRLGSKPLEPIGKWTSICEHKERGCEYIEIDLPLSRNYRLQRCLLIDHKDKVLLLADSVLADEEEPHRKQMLSCRSELYFSPKLRPKTTDKTTEIEFRSASRTDAPPFRVFPLALPEWKPEKQTGTLTEEKGKLVLRQETSGKSLFAPFFFDLDSERLGKQYTWRQLTVGENLQKVAEDQAVGYRVQLGKEQFLLYRSLSPQANRTLLGHNLIDDFCFARFDPETGVDPLIAVEIVD